jgi:hypothetical protein
VRAGSKEEMFQFSEQGFVRVTCGMLKKRRAVTNKEEIKRK